MLHSRKENRKSDPQPSETTMRKGQRPKRTLAQLDYYGRGRQSSPLVPTSIC